MSTTTNSIRAALKEEGLWSVDAAAGPASTQATATRISANVTIVKESVASGSMILPSLLTSEALKRPYWVINETAVAVVVYSALGETMNGSLNANLSIPTGDGAVFIPVRNAAGNVDWRSSVIA